MAYKLEGYERWDVYIKSKDFTVKRIDDRFGVKIGVTEPQILSEAIKSDNQIENTQINLIDNTNDSTFYKEVSIISGKSIMLNLVGQDSMKIVSASGYFYSFIEFIGSPSFLYNIKCGNAKKILNLTLCTLYS